MTQVAERLEADRREPRRKPREWFLELVMPRTTVGWMAVGFVGVLLPVSWLLSAWSPHLGSGLGEIDVLTPQRSEDILGVLWQVHVAIAAIALPILVFSIDLAGNRPGVAATTQEVLIRESFIFPILAFGLALATRVGIDFVWFARPAVVVVDLGLLAGLILSTIFAFLRTLQLIFSRARLQQEALNLLGERMDEVVDQSLRTRIANGMLLEWGADFGLGYHPFTDRRGRESFINLTSTKRGRIADFQLDRIRRLIDSLPRRVSGPSPTRNVFGLPESESPAGPTEVVWLRNRVGDVITDDSPELLRVDASIFQSFDESDFADLLDRAIRVEAGHEVDKASELRSQIAYVRDSLTDGITGGRTGLVEDALDIYQALCATFLKKLKELEDSYSLSLVQSQESWLFARGWAEVEWIRDSVRQAIDDGTASTNSSILLDVLFVPARLANTAFAYRDLKLFHSFLGLIPYSYWTLAQRDDDRVRDLGVDRAWRYLTERLDLYLLPAIEDADSASEAKSTLPFAETAMAQFSHLLKVAYDERKPEDFEKFAKALKGLLRYWHDRSGELHAAEWRLESDDLTEGESLRLKREVELLQSLQQVHEALVTRKSVIQFGLSAWIVFDYSDGRRSADEALKYMRHMTLPSDIRTLWQLARSAATYGEWDDLEWRSWELGTKEEGEAHFIEITSYIYLTFLLRALTLIANGDESSLPESEEFRHLAASDGQLMKLLEGIEAKPDKWKPFVDESAMEQIPKLRKRLAEANQKAEEKERQALIGAPIDEMKKAGVISLVETGWRDEGILRRLAEEWGAYEFIDVVPDEDLLPFGLNQLDTKHAYVADTDVHTTDWGRDWGRSLARGENQMVLGVLQTQLPVLEPSRDATIEQALRTGLDRLRATGCQPVILINRSWKAQSAIERSPDFEWPPDRERDLVGFFHKTPVYNLHTDGAEEIVIVDLNAAIRWKQFHPPTLSKDQAVVGDVVSVAIEEFDESKAKELIDKWTEEGGSPNWTVETLRERVGLRIFERFEIEVRDKQAGLRVSIGPPRTQTSSQETPEGEE